MALLDVFDVSGSAMAAQTVRLNTTASNLANAQSVAENPEDTYRARHPVFAQHMSTFLSNPDEQTDAPAESAGVQILGIVESDAAFERRYQPDHPYADENGFVTYPNVSVVEEMANMISASRSFQLNVEVMNTARTLAERVLTLGQ